MSYPQPSAAPSDSPGVPRSRLVRRPAIDLELQARARQATGADSLEDAVRRLLDQRVELARLLRDGEAGLADRVLAALALLEQDPLGGSTAPAAPLRRVGRGARTAR